MYNLSNEERLELAAFVNKVVAGRASVVGSGTFEGSVEEQAAFCTKMAEHVDAVVVLTCQMAAETDSDEVWKSNVNDLFTNKHQKREYTSAYAHTHTYSRTYSRTYSHTHTRPNSHT